RYALPLLCAVVLRARLDGGAPVSGVGPDPRGRGERAVAPSERALSRVGLSGGAGRDLGVSGRTRLPSSCDPGPVPAKPTGVRALAGRPGRSAGRARGL